MRSVNRSEASLRQKMGAIVVLITLSVFGFLIWKAYQLVSGVTNSPPPLFSNPTSVTVETNEICGASETDLMILIPNAYQQVNHVDALYDLIERGKAYTLKIGAPVLLMSEGDGNVRVLISAGTNAGVTCFVTLQQAERMSTKSRK